MKFLDFFKMILKSQDGIFGLFTSDPEPFVLPDQRLKALIDKEIAFAESPITGPSQAGQISLDELDRQQQLAQSQAAQAEQAGLASGLSNLQLYGGAGGGSGERLARQARNRGLFGQQQLRSDFSGQRAGLLAGDLGREQERRDIARRTGLESELGLLGARTSAELGNRAAKAQRAAAIEGSLGSLASIGLFAAGGGFA